MPTIIGESKQRFWRGLRSPRSVRGYPFRSTTLIRRTRKTGVKREFFRTTKGLRRRKRFRTSFNTRQDLEARAVPSSQVYGSLQERILYRALTDRGLIPDVDFEFQSSQLGGRSDMGGLVVDFLFPVPKVVIQVQSSWHILSLDNIVRDVDQSLVLQSLGFVVLELWPNIIEDRVLLDEWLDRNIMLLWGTSSQPLGVSVSDRDWASAWGGGYDEDLSDILRMCNEIYEEIS